MATTFERNLSRSFVLLIVSDGSSSGGSFSAETPTVPALYTRTVIYGTCFLSTGKFAEFTMTAAGVRANISGNIVTSVDPLSSSFAPGVDIDAGKQGLIRSAVRDGISLCQGGYEIVASVTYREGRDVNSEVVLGAPGYLAFAFDPYWAYCEGTSEPPTGKPPTTGVSTDNPFGPVTPSIPLVGVPDVAEAPCLTPSFVQPAPPISTPCASASNGSTTQGTFTKLS